jgi:sulfoxide reductase heme-binding subunit YedZ
MQDKEIQRYSRPMKLSVQLIALLYLLWLAGEALLGMQPVAVTINRLGLGALTSLTLCLACTPVNIVFGFPPVRRLRRMLGLYAFYFACLHLVALIGWLYRLSWDNFLQGLSNSLTQQVGLAAFIILLVLALTSLKRLRQMLRRNWKRLHRLAYAAGVLGALHLLGAPDSPVVLGVVYLAIILLLLAIRLPPVKNWFERRHAVPE